MRETKTENGKREKLDEIDLDLIFMDFSGTIRITESL